MRKWPLSHSPITNPKTAEEILLYKPVHSLKSGKPNTGIPNEKASNTILGKIINNFNSPQKKVTTLLLDYLGIRI